MVLFGLVGLTVVTGIARGVADAGGWTFGWTQGLREPANALRLGKVFFAALLAFLSEVQLATKSSRDTRILSKKLSSRSEDADD